MPNTYGKGHENKVDRNVYRGHIITFFTFFGPLLLLFCFKTTKNGIYMKNRAFKKKAIKLDNFKILGCGDLQGHVTTLKVQIMNSGPKINQKKKKVLYPMNILKIIGPWRLKHIL